MLIFGGGLTIYFGVQRFIHPEKIEKIYLAFGAVCFSIITNGYAMSVSIRRLLEKEKLVNFFRVFSTTTHVETKNTFILDFTGAASAVIGLISLLLYQFAKVEYFDAVGAILIGVVIVVSSVMLIMGVKDYIIGKTATPETENQIKESVLKLQQVDEVVDLETMYIGSEKLLVHLGINLKSANPDNLEKTIDQIKEHIQKEIPIIYSIHIEIRKMI